MTTILAKAMDISETLLPTIVTERAKIIDRLLATIENANLLAPTYAKVSNTHTLFTDPQEPVLRTAKGTIRRQITLDLYAPQIEQLYIDVEDAWTLPKTRLNMDSGDAESLKFVIRG